MLELNGATGRIEGVNVDADGVPQSTWKDQTPTPGASNPRLVSLGSTNTPGEPGGGGRGPSRSAGSMPNWRPFAGTKNSTIRGFGAPASMACRSKAAAITPVLEKILLGFAVM